ncbi:MAG: spore coat protein [Bacilli bacterium]
MNCSESKNKEQAVKQETSADQVQIQGVKIKDSHTITIDQVETQALFLVQIALQAAIEALIVALDFTEDDQDLEKLQSIVQTLEYKQIEKEKIEIINSDDITITQTEVQVALVVQAAIDLLAKITAKLVEADI